MEYTNASYKDHFSQTKDRLKNPSLWFPYPVLISFVLAVVLAGYSLPNLNIYFGQPSSLIQQDIVDNKTPSGSIWITASVIDNELIITTFDRKIFKWNREIKNITDIENFISYLKTEVERRSIQAGLAAGIHPGEVEVTIAADRGLKFLHIRPIINALAEAGISAYSFETKTKNFSKNQQAEDLQTL